MSVRIRDGGFVEQVVVDPEVGEVFAHAVSKQQPIRLGLHSRPKALGLVGG